MARSSTISYLGPAFLVYVGCMDPGKWAAALEGGSRCGFELIWVMIGSCVLAAFLQSLSTRLGLATGRNLAQICRDQFPWYLSIFLWIQCEVSVLILDLTMVLGIAMTLKALLGITMVLSVILTIAASIFFLVALPHLGLYKAELSSASIMGVVLLCFSVDALFSNRAALSAVFNGTMPKLKGDNLYIAAGIVGANIIPCTFYLHSALVQDEKQKNPLIYAPEILLHHSIVDIATGTGVTLLVNLSVLSAAAAAFHSSGHVVITLQDAQALMEQVLSNSVAPAAFGFALLCAGEFSSFTWTVAGQVATEGFLGLKAPSSFYRIFTRLGTTLTALCLVLSLGSEGMYQVLIFFQVILAFQLPLVIIPLLKVTSSTEIMGSLRSSWPVGCSLWICTGLLYMLNVWVAVDMFPAEGEEYLVSGNWSSSRELDGTVANWGDLNRFLYAVGLAGFIALSALASMYIVSAPLKAEVMKSSHSIVSTFPETISRRPMEPLKDHILDGNCRSSSDDSVGSYLLGADTSTECHEPLVDTNVALPYESLLDAPKGEYDLPGTDNSTDNDLNLGTFAAVKENKLCSEPLHDEFQCQSSSEVCMSTEVSAVIDPSASESSLSKEKTNSWAGDPTQSTAVVTDTLPTQNSSSSNVPEPLKETFDDVDLELLDNNDFDIDAWESLDQDDVLQDSSSALGGSVNSLTFEEPGSGRSFSARSDVSEGSCGGSGSGSLSRLSGLGRSARKQFAALLDEFWGKLYDLHGQTVSQTLGRSRGSSARDKSQHHSVPTNREALGPNSKWYTSNLAQRSWEMSAKGDTPGQNDVFFRPSYNSVLNPDTYSGNGSFMQTQPPLDVNEKRYSSLGYSSFRDSFDNQPATIHGYSVASYVGRDGNFSTAMDSNAFLAERQRRLMQRSLNGQNSSVYRHPALNRSELESILSSGSMKSYLSSQHTTASVDRRFENSSITSRPNAPQTNWSDLYSRPRWTSIASHDSAAWNPLVSRATGEFDMSQHDQVALQKERDYLNSMILQHQTGEKGYPSSMGSRQFEARTDRGPLSFNELSPSQANKTAFSTQSASQNESLWATQPFEQLFGSTRSPIGSGRATAQNSVTKGLDQNETSLSHRKGQMPIGNDNEIEVLNMLRLCIRKLLKLEGSEWLFRLDSGSDEDLIALVATREKVLIDADTRELHKLHIDSDQLWATSSQKQVASSNFSSSTLSSSGVPHCGEGCVWSGDLQTSFGVWCIHRILELALMESRPELWGKYTYVLNRLQGVLDPAFSKPRVVQMACICVMSESPEEQGRGLLKHGSLKDGGMGDVISRTLSGGFPGNSYQGFPQSWPWGRNSSISKGKGANSSIFLEIIKDVETAVGTRKGRTGTAAGDVAFPKGKENLASVLKRYKRRLGNRNPGTPSNSGSSNAGNRRVLSSSPAIFG